MNLLLVDRIEEFSRIACKFLWQQNLIKKNRNEAKITKIVLKFFWTLSVNFLSKIIFPEKYQFVRPIFDIDMFPFKIITELPSFEKF